MIVQMITAVLLSGFAMLFVWAGFRTFKKPMPGSWYAIIAAVTMISYGIYSEYTWAGRTKAQFPESFAVVHELPGKSVFSPWSFLIPRVDRLSVIDTDALVRNEALPDHVMAKLILMQRFLPHRQAYQMVDCKQGLRTDLMPPEQQQFDERQLPLNAQWEPLEADHPLLQVMCM